MQELSTNQKLIALSAAGLMIGLGIGFAVGRIHARSSGGYALRDADADYRFVKPLLACNVSDTQESDDLDELQEQFEQIIKKAKSNGSAERASVYYRNVNSGSWTSVNPDESFTPASLMKLPVLMAYLKQAETNPDLLSMEITVQTDPAPNRAQDIPGSATVEVGKTYTIEELLRLMIIQSDNRALNLLMTSVDVETLQETLEDLNVPDPVEAEQTNYTLTTRVYSRFFRILYNGTYLHPEISEYALAMLAEVEFDAALIASTPDGTSVAHKFGEATATLADGSTGHQLHECGIVYSDTPYLLCVMTEGASTDTLADVIADINRAAYNF